MWPDPERIKAKRFTVQGFHPRAECQLVRDLVRLFLPTPKGSERFLTHHLQHGNLALGERPSDLLVYEGIVEPDLGRVGGEIAEMNSAEVCPVDRAKTHRAGFARSVNFAILESE